MSCCVNYIRVIGNTRLPYMTIVWHLSFPEHTLDSACVHPRPPLTIPKSAHEEIRCP